MGLESFSAWVKTFWADSSGMSCPSAQMARMRTESGVPGCALSRTIFSLPRGAIRFGDGLLFAQIPQRDAHFFLNDRRGRRQTARDFNAASLSFSSPISRTLPSGRPDRNRREGSTRRLCDLGIFHFGQKLRHLSTDGAVRMLQEGP